jgi:hypothetical protein
MCLLQFSGLVQAAAAFYHRIVILFTYPNFSYFACSENPKEDLHVDKYEPAQVP